MAQGAFEAIAGFSAPRTEAWGKYFQEGCKGKMRKDVHPPRRQVRPLSGVSETGETDAYGQTKDGQ